MQVATPFDRTKYPKINSVMMRDPETNFKTFLNEWSEPEFEVLAGAQWDATEKLDGTNIRVEWHADTEEVILKGRTDKALLPADLVTHLERTLPAEKMRKAFGPSDCVLYGEGIGPGIQKGGGNYGIAQHFALFDIKIGGIWLERNNVEAIAAAIKVPVAPSFGRMSLHTAMELCANGFQSKYADAVSPEGLVLRAPLGLMNRKGERLITKVKCKDFNQSGKEST